MVNYSNGKVYKIEPIVEHDDGDIYIGSTTKTYLSQRMDTHRGDYKRYKEGRHHFITVYKLFNKYGVENCKIVLLESCQNITTKDELLSREHYYIKTLKCVNKSRRSETYKRIIYPKCECICGVYYQTNCKKAHEESFHHKQFINPSEYNTKYDNVSRIFDGVIELTDDKKNKLSTDDIYNACKTECQKSCVELKEFSQHLRKKYRDKWNNDIRFGKSRGGFIKMRLKVNINIEIENDDEEEIKELERELEELLKKTI